MELTQLITVPDLARIARDNGIDPNDSAMADRLAAMGLPYESGLWVYWSSDRFSLPESDFEKIGEIEDSEDYRQMITNLVESACFEAIGSESVADLYALFALSNAINLYG